MMVDAELADGSRVESVIHELLRQEAARYLHIHYAKPGCYAALVERA